MTNRSQIIFRPSDFFLITKEWIIHTKNENFRIFEQRLKTLKKIFFPALASGAGAAKLMMVRKMLETQITAMDRQRSLNGVALIVKVSNSQTLLKNPYQHFSILFFK